jgi:ornithine decarboxylase
MQNAVRGLWHNIRQHPDRAVNWCHLDRLRSNVNLWKSFFPGITPYYAVKCNPHPFIVNHLNSLGVSFDCASANEIKQVQASTKLLTDSALKSGSGQASNGIMHKVPSIIFANPVKNPHHLQFAKKVGVNRMTADCPEEVEKIQQYYPDAEIVLRIAVDDSQSICKFNSKFGLVPTKEGLSRFFNKIQPDAKAGTARTGPQVIGTSFHVGSGCLSALSYKDAIEKSRYVFDFAKARGINMTMLDIGGGFVQEQPLLTTVAKTINTELSLWKSTSNTFPKEVIAEPGRFLAKKAFDLYATVIGKKREGNHMKYYINDGVYGSFNCIMFDHISQFEFDIYRQCGSKAIPHKISKNLHGKWEVPTLKTTIFGETCDSIDVILKEIDVPELEIGDHICFHEMGAYTLAAAGKFNGFPTAMVYATDASTIVGHSF